MLHRSILVLAFGCCLHFAFAQPIITDGNNSPAPGDVFTFLQGEFREPPPSGEEDALWDFSDFTGTSTVVFSYAAPPFDAPEGTTVVELGDGDLQTFYQATPSALLLVGFTTGPDLTMACSYPETMLEYPITFGSSRFFSSSCDGQEGGTVFNRSTNVTQEGYSWGTLVLPYGTFDNVLMVFTYRSIYRVIGGDASGEGHISHYYDFLRPGSKAPLFSIQRHWYSHVPEVYCRMADPLTVGMDDTIQPSGSIDLFPNPASDRVEVVIGMDATAMLRMEVVDITGKVVRDHQRSSKGPDVVREVLDLSGLSSGIYTVRVMGRQGALGAKRLVVQ